jgi:hypothetical protein
MEDLADDVSLEVTDDVAFGETFGGAAGDVIDGGAGVSQVGSPNDCNDNFAAVIAASSVLHPDVGILEGSSNVFGATRADAGR